MINYHAGLFTIGKNEDFREMFKICVFLLTYLLTNCISYKIFLYIIISKCF